MTSLSKAIFLIQVATLDLVFRNSTDVQTRQELADAHHIEDFPWKRRRQIRRNVRKMIEILAGLHR